MCTFNRTLHHQLDQMQIIHAFLSKTRHKYFNPYLTYSMMLTFHSQMARAGFIRRDRQHLRRLLADCELEWTTLNCEVNRINRVRVSVCFKISR